MQEVKLGAEPDHGAERDAIHVAVYPTCAAVKVYPGQHVGHGIDGATPKMKPIGIVDPFLNHPIMPGEKFWIIMFPDTARNLRHDWKHPDVDRVFRFREESTPGAAPLDPEKRGLARVDKELAEKIRERELVKKKLGLREAPLSGAGQEVAPSSVQYATLKAVDTGEEAEAEEAEAEEVEAEEDDEERRCRLEGCDP